MPRNKTGLKVSQTNQLLISVHGTRREEKSPNKKIEEAKEHHLDEDALDTT